MKDIDFLKWLKENIKDKKILNEVELFKIKQELDNLEFSGLFDITVEDDEGNISYWSSDTTWEDYDFAWDSNDRKLDKK